MYALCDQSWKHNKIKVYTYKKKEIFLFYCNLVMVIHFIKHWHYSIFFTLYFVPVQHQTKPYQLSLDEAKMDCAFAVRPSHSGRFLLMNNVLLPRCICMIISAGNYHHYCCFVTTKSLCPEEERLVIFHSFFLLPTKLTINNWHIASLRIVWSCWFVLKQLERLITSIMYSFFGE